MFLVDFDSDDEAQQLHDALEGAQSVDADAHHLLRAGTHDHSQHTCDSTSCSMRRVGKTQGGLQQQQQ